MDNTKVFVILIVIMLILALFSTFYAKRFTVKYGTFYPPYANILGAYTSDGKLYVTIKIQNETYPINITGGYVKIVNTGQYTNVTPTYNDTFNISFPITYSLSSFSLVSIEGVLKGIMKGNTIYITFSSTVPIQIYFDIKVVKFVYNNSTANITLYIFNPVNITLLCIRSLSITNANLSETVAGINLVDLNLSLPVGTHCINLTVNLMKEGGVVYEKQIQPGYAYYISGVLNIQEYFSQPQNASFQLYKIELFS
ncbi:hypothetical protein DJ528_04320 [Sulfolobus sp. B5]|nr:hypothetical protein DJ528_04320 [Sulfolobus sp. B5]